MTLMLEEMVFIHIRALWTAVFPQDRDLTAERVVLNILTIIARRLAALLTFGASDDYDTGAKLFCLFSFAQATDHKGHAVAWDLGSYLREVAGRLSEQDPAKEISLRRLILVLRRLRPLCAPREDLRADWERISLAPDDDYQELFWDAEDFELGPLLDPDAHIASLDGST